MTDNCSLRKLQTRWIFVKTSSVTKITFCPSFQSNKTNIKLENPHDVDKSLFVCMSRNLHEDCYCWVFYQLLLSNFGSMLTRCSYNFLNLTDELFWQRYNLVSKGWLERDTLPLGINICGDFLGLQYYSLPFPFLPGWCRARFTTDTDVLWQTLNWSLEMNKQVIWGKKFLTDEISTFDDEIYPLV